MYRNISTVTALGGNIAKIRKQQDILLYYSVTKLFIALGISISSYTIFISQYKADMPLKMVTKCMKHCIYLLIHFNSNKIVKGHQSVTQTATVEK